MKNRWLTGVAAAALTVAGAVAAQAADLPTRKEAPAPVYIPPPFTWTGFYVGANIGGIWKNGNNTGSLVVPGTFIFLQGDLPNGGNSGNSGVIGGGQAGYNWQTGMFVLGVETDFQGTSVSRSVDRIGPTFLFPNGQTDFLSVHAKASLDWLGTTRARVGFVATPDNRLMFYGTGGVAYAGGSSNFTVFDNLGGVWTGSPSSSRTGWTLGAGVEYAITYNWTLKAEYLYVDLGSKTITTAANAFAALNFPGVYATAKFNYDASIFRVGVNYKF